MIWAICRRLPRSVSRKKTCYTEKKISCIHASWEKHFPVHVWVKKIQKSNSSPLSGCDKTWKNNNNNKTNKQAKKERNKTNQAWTVCLFLRSLYDVDQMYEFHVFHFMECLVVHWGSQRISFSYTIPVIQSYLAQFRHLWIQLMQILFHGMFICPLRISKDIIKSHSCYPVLRSSISSFMNTINANSVWVVCFQSKAEGSGTWIL